MDLRLDQLPRTIEMVRANGIEDYIPEGGPVLRLLDQTKLPYEEVYIDVVDWRQVIDCIKSLVVRGAPAIGIAGSAAVLLRAAEFVHGCDKGNGEGVPSDFLPLMEEAASEIKTARPTAVNLAWAVDASMDIVREEIETGASLQTIEERLYEHVCQMIVDDEMTNRAIGRYGAELLPHNARILTHCNAGSLATAFYGTALGVVYAAAESRGIEMVYSDETRPVGQGARLTVWELSRAGVPVTLICDDMAASVMAAGKVDAVVVGADRIASNGDFANKIGTLGIALIARNFNIPFYVAAPTSTIDSSLSDGSQIPIEERDPSEVLANPIDGVEVFNPAFDVTPASLVTRIVTEHGSFEPEKITEALNLPRTS